MKKMTNRKGMVSGNRKIKTGQTIDLKQPSYKWLVCRKCNYNEVRVSVEATGCVCSICLTRACDYTPMEKKIPKTTKTKNEVMSTFAKHELEAKEQAELAKGFKKKKTNIKNGIVAEKKTKTKKKTKKKHKYTKRKNHAN